MRNQWRSQSNKVTWLFLLAEKTRRAAALRTDCNMKMPGQFIRGCCHQLFVPARQGGGQEGRSLSVCQSTLQDQTGCRTCTSCDVGGSNKQALWILIDIYIARQSRHAFGGHCSSIVTWYRARYRTIPIAPDTTQYRPIPDTRCWYRSFSNYNNSRTTRTMRSFFP